MTETDALRLMSTLVTTTNGWDDASVMEWTGRISDLPDTPAAITAMKHLSNTWTWGTRPTWARFLEFYEANLERPVSIGPGDRHTGVSFTGHLASLEQRAAKGDTSAASELRTWRHHTGFSRAWIRHAMGLQP